MFANRSNEFLGSMSICFSAFMYATLPILVKLAYASGLTAGNALWLRYLFSFVLLAIFISLVTKGSLLSLSPPVIAQGIFLTIGGLLYFYALEWLSAGVATIIFFSHPVFVAVLSFVVYKEKIVLHLLLGLLLAVLGIVLVSGIGGLSSSLPPLGLVYALSSCLCYTLYSLVGQKAMGQHDPLSVTATISMLAILLLTPVFYRDLAALSQITPEQFGIALAMAVLNTLLAVLFFLKGLKRIGAARATLLSTAEPVFCLLMAYIILGESLSFRQITGSAMILASMLLAVYNRPASLEKI